MGIIFVLSFYQKLYLHCSCLVIERTGFIRLSLFHSLIPRLLSCVRFRASSTGGLTSLSTLGEPVMTVDSSYNSVTRHPMSFWGSQLLKKFTFSNFFCVLGIHWGLALLLHSHGLTL